MADVIEGVGPCRHLIKCGPAELTAAEKLIERIDEPRRSVGQKSEGDREHRRPYPVKDDIAPKTVGDVIHAPIVKRPGSGHKCKCVVRMALNEFENKTRISYK